MRETGMVPEDGGLTPVQAQIVEYLESGPKRKVLAAFRGAGKSTLAAMYGKKRLYDNPNLKVLIISASLGRAEAMTAWMLKTISDLNWLRHMQPNTHDGRYSRIAFDVGNCTFIEQSPSVRAAGINGQITGSRADLIIVDDCETPTTALTHVQRSKLRNALNELEAILKPGPESEIVYLGTPHSSTDSIYFTLNRELNYQMRMWPARVPKDVIPYRNCLAPIIENQVGIRDDRPTDTRFSEDELLQRQLSMSPMQWRLQFMLDATLSDVERYPLRCADLMVTTVDRFLPEIVMYEKGRYLAIEDLPCVGMAHDSRFYRPVKMEGAVSVDGASTVMALDPSGGGADEFAWAIVKALNGNYFLVESGGHLGGVSENLWKRLAGLAKSHKVNEILVETNFGGVEVYAQLLKPFLTAAGHSTTVTPIRSNKQKELRIIDTLAPVMQTHRMIVDQRVIETDAEILKNAKDERDTSYSVFYQMTRLTYDRGSLLHDDRLDAWAMAVQYFQEQAAQNQQLMSEARKTELLMAELEDWNGSVILTPQRLAMGMTLEQARQAGSGGRHSWIS